MDIRGLRALSVFSPELQTFRYMGMDPATLTALFREDYKLVMFPAAGLFPFSGFPSIETVHRVIFHLDMDAFYASVEQRDQPALRGKPVIVGGSPNSRGVVCAASYEARKFGVRSAMPSATAGRLCPRGVFIRPRMDAYRNESREIMKLLAGFGAVIEQVSVDEAYLDISRLVSGDSVDEALYHAVPIAKRMKQQVREQRRLTASIGVAANKLLAKLASDFQKPDGLTLVPERDKVAFLRPLPVRAIHGVGRVTEATLLQAGIRTVADLQDHPGDLRELVGSFGPVLKRYAVGEDDRPLDLSDDVQSISAEETFARDTEDRKVLRACLKEQADDIARRLARRRLCAKTIQVKLRYGDFRTLSRQMTFEEPIETAATIYRLGCWLLGREKLVNRPLRLLGLGVSGLEPVAGQQLWLGLTPNGAPGSTGAGREESGR
jgi:DNA polymerase-4